MLTREKQLLAIIGIGVLWISCTSVWAETIRLKNGRIFEGEIIDETDDEVKIEIKSGIVYFSRDEIASIGDRKISQKEIKDASKNLDTPSEESAAQPKKAVAKEKAKPVAVSNPSRQKERKPVKKVKKTNDVPAVVADTVTVTSLAVSTDTLPSVSSETVTLPVALPEETKKEVPRRTNPLVLIILVVLAIIAAILVFVIIAKRKSRS